MSKIHVGVGEDFPVDDASVREADTRPCPSQRNNNGGCAHASAWEHGYRRHYHGAGLMLGLAGAVAAVALLSLAVTQPLMALGLLALLVAGAAVLGHRVRGRYRHGWYDRSWHRSGPEAARSTSQGPKAPEPHPQPGEQP